jgi:hypothetical protein
MREPSRRDAVAVVTACLLHGAALATAAWLGPPLVRLVAPPITLTLELEPIVASEERAEERTADVVEDTEESLSRPVSARRSRVHVEPVAAVGSIGPSGGSSEDVAREPSLLEPSLPRGAGPIDVDPRRLAPSEIARASVLAQVEGPIAPSQSGPSTLVVPRTETDAESRLTGHLRDRAMSKTYVTRRARVRLIPRPDGSLHYDGSAFDADIRPDGTVERELVEEAALDEQALVFRAVGERERLVVDRHLRERPGLEQVDEAHRLRRVSLSTPLEPDDDAQVVRVLVELDGLDVAQPGAHHDVLRLGQCRHRDEQAQQKRAHRSDCRGRAQCFQWKHASAVNVTIGHFFDSSSGGAPEARRSTVRA